MSKSRILFVDDEPNALAALRSLLRKDRKEVELAFAAGAEEALGILAREPFDVLVTDLQLAGTDGATLLRRTSEEFPGVARIVLTGMTGSPAAEQAFPVAHQLIAKPCTADSFRSALTRARRLQATLADTRLREALGGLQALPSPPRTYVEVTRLLDAEDVDLSTVATVIEQDPAVAAKVVQVANTAFFAPPRPLTTVSGAVQRLGARMIGTIVACVDALGAFGARVRVPGITVDREVGHALDIAQLCKAIAPTRELEAQAMLAGVLHDVGRLALANTMQDEMSRVVRDSRDRKLPMWRAEQELFGFDHADAGGYLLGIWGLPNPLVEAVATHHRPEPTTELDLPTIVHLADGLLRAAQHRTDPRRPDYLDLDLVQRFDEAGQLDPWIEDAARILSEGA